MRLLVFLVFFDKCRTAVYFIYYILYMDNS